VILIASDSHRSALYSLHVPDLLSVSETFFPSPDVPAKRLKTSVAIGHNSEGDAALRLRKERQLFPKLSNYQRRKKSTNTIMLNVNCIICKTIHTSFYSSPQNEDSFWGHPGFEKRKTGTSSED
jgi:hypothetical protein